MRATLTQHVVHAQASLLVVLLREVVVRGALLARYKALKFELLAGPHTGGSPLGEAALLVVLHARGVLLLGDDLAGLRLHEIPLRDTALGLVSRAAPHTPVGPALDLRGLARIKCFAQCVFMFFNIFWCCTLY